MRTGLVLAASAALAATLGVSLPARAEVTWSYDNIMVRYTPPAELPQPPRGAYPDYMASIIPQAIRNQSALAKVISPQVITNRPGGIVFPLPANY